MGKSRWNDSLIAVLAETYPVETTTYTAALLGMSETAVKNKAKKLASSRSPSPDGWNVPNISAAIFKTSLSPKWQRSWAFPR